MSLVKRNTSSINMHDKLITIRVNSGTALASKTLSSEQKKVAPAKLNLLIVSVTVADTALDQLP